ncbi:MAG: PIN domain-containing protein [Syntrophales bacterium]|jgi:predicted nucleic acid-binding protein|nr:PIN domain-containing protein [Syntrophales bacterium]
MAKPTAPRGPYLLDTSALLTFIEDEPGSDRVEKVLRDAAILLPWPVLLETYYITLQEKGRAEADRRYALLRQLRAEILWAMDEPILLTAARLKAEHHVSLADAVVAAFAIRNNAVLIHKDPEFDALAGLLPMEALPYKAK